MARQMGGLARWSWPIVPVGNRILAVKTNKNLPFTHLSLPPLTPLLPALTLSAGELKVSQR